MHVCLTRVCVRTSQDIKFNVHAHPTLSEVLDELFKQAHLEGHTPGADAQPSKSKSKQSQKREPVPA